MFVEGLCRERIEVIIEREYEVRIRTQEKELERIMITDQMKLGKEEERKRNWEMIEKTKREEKNFKNRKERRI